MITDFSHRPSEVPGYWMVFCYEYYWAYRPAVIDDFGNIVRVNTARARHSAFT